MNKRRTLTTPNAGEDVHRNSEWYFCFGKHFSSFLQNQPYSYYMMQQSRSLIFTQMLKTVYYKTCTQILINIFILYKHHFFIYINIFISCFIHTCQNVEATMVSFRRWMDKLTVVHPGNDIFFSARKKCYQAIKRDGGTLNAYY